MFNWQGCCAHKTNYYNYHCYKTLIFHSQFCLTSISYPDQQFGISQFHILGLSVTLFLTFAKLSNILWYNEGHYNRGISTLRSMNPIYLSCLYSSIQWLRASNVYKQYHYPNMKDDREEMQSMWPRQNIYSATFYMIQETVIYYSQIFSVILLMKDLLM